jgi:hypothetical protein
VAAATGKHAERGEGVLTLYVDSRAQVWLDGNRLGVVSESASWTVEAGEHELRVSAAGRTLKREFRVDPGEASAIRLEFKPRRKGR